MPRYLLLFHDDRCDITTLTQKQRDTLFGEFVDWADSLAQRGHYAGSDALKPNAEAKTVRKRGETLVLEGPFAETHEAVNGYIAVEAADLDQAVTLAGECPSLAFGWAVEVRELVEVEKPSGGPSPSGA